MLSQQVNIMQHIFYLFAIKMLGPRFSFAEELYSCLLNIMHSSKVP